MGKNGNNSLSIEHNEEIQVVFHNSMDLLIRFNNHKKGHRKTLPSLERPVRVVAERELIVQNCDWKKKKKKKTKIRK